ncbi:hypothetical protein BT67DRAFT_459164 [Trichocladium antarcticum]|uniref:Lon N-terminal domain-containing protein n=1 Tax=Trichocladium antarcticum TaxID=1450529 RepID=A0AAN6USU4_9PEZI|nr:hypothetical protein BT67DRAFT_459164 [Trichocladium antarcticum]
MHVFEPRYRLMVRHVLDGDRMFGVVGRAEAGFSAVGTLVRIERFEFTRDGRIFIQVVGLSRFRITQHSLRNGYVEARVKPIYDIGISDEEEREAAETGGSDGEEADLKRASSSGCPVSKEEIDRTPTTVIMEHCLAYVRGLQSRGLYFPHTRFQALLDMCPADPATFPWWFASIMSAEDSWKYQLLSRTSVRERLKFCLELVLETESQTWWNPSKFCAIM